MKTVSFSIIKDGESTSATRVVFDPNRGSRLDFVKAFKQLSVSDRRYLYDTADSIMIEYQMGNRNRPEVCALIIPEILVSIYALAGLLDYYAIAGACAERILGKDAESPFVMERWYPDKNRWGFPSWYREYVYALRVEYKDKDRDFRAKSPYED